MCRQLRCGEAERAYNPPKPQRGTGPVGLRGVRCAGHEANLTQCNTSLPMSVLAAGIAGDVGVVHYGSLVPSGQRPLWGWMSSGFCLQGPAAPRGICSAACAILPNIQSRALGSVLATLTSFAGGCNLGGLCQGYMCTPAHTACESGGSLVPAHPPSQPSSPSPLLQLHPGQQHLRSDHVTCPPRWCWVFSGPAVTHGGREEAPCWDVKLPGGGTGIAVGGGGWGGLSFGCHSVTHQGGIFLMTHSWGHLPLV